HRHAIRCQVVLAYNATRANPPRLPEHKGDATLTFLRLVKQPPEPKAIHGDNLVLRQLWISVEPCVKADVIEQRKHFRPVCALILPDARKELRPWHAIQARPEEATLDIENFESAGQQGVGTFVVVNVDACRHMPKRETAARLGKRRFCQRPY